jgi:hypothetical protein
VMSRDIVDPGRLDVTPLGDDPFRVQCELSDEGAVGSQEPDVTVRHQDQDGLAVVPAPDAQVVERALVAQRDIAPVHLVLADSAVRRDLEGLA